MSAAPGSPAEGPLAIVAGGGGFPLAVADAVAASGRQVFVLGLEGIADPAIARHPHAWVGLGKLGRFFALACEAGCREAVLVGAVVRPPDWRALVPDLGLLRRLPRLLRLFRGGDDHVLTGVAAILEDGGIAVRGVHEVAPRLLMPAGVLGAHAPSAEALAEIAFACEVLAATGGFDIGQGVVVADRRVLALEAAEGTDAMLERVAGLRASGRLKLRGRRGVFVKAPKPGQDLRLDLPALGPETVSRAAAAGLAGIAGPAGRLLALDTVAMVAAADAAGLFLYGLAEPPP